MHATYVLDNIRVEAGVHKISARCPFCREVIDQPADYYHICSLSDDLQKGIDSLHIATKKHSLDGMLLCVVSCPANFNRLDI